jgi:hypothetical protein
LKANMKGKIIFNSVIRKLLSILGTTQICKSTFSIVDYMTSKCGLGTSDENLEPNLR